MKASFEIAKRLSILALAAGPEADEQSAAINCFMAGAMLMAFSVEERSTENFESLLDDMLERTRAAVHQMIHDEKNKKAN